MSKAIPFLLQGKNIILVVNGKSYTISKDTHIAYSKIVDALKARDWDALTDLVEPKKVIINFGNGNVSVVDNKIMWKGQPFHNALASRMVEMCQDGFPIEPMVRFMENLMQNPSKRSVDQVYGFLEKNKLPITEDGHFLAYKKVREDYMDIHSNSISNHIGEVVEMDRNLVDDNPDSHCSTGLHFCSESYLGSFGGANQPVMILKINPADVVSIPTDYDGAKGRCMRYEVVGQVNGAPADAFTSVVNKEFSPKSAWPFPTSADIEHMDEDEPDEDLYNAEYKTPTTQLYDLHRKLQRGWVEYQNMTLAEAREQVAKNIRQKKVQLKIVVAGTYIDVN